MVRAPTYDENGIKKGAWSKEEDDKLRAYILKYGHWNWRELPKFAGVSRSGMSCRLRWVNYLRPNLKHGNYTKEEEDTIIKLRKEHGNKWALIASKLPGRTDNEIKNYWYHLKKRKNKDQASMEEHTNEANQIGEAESQSINQADTPSPLSPTSVGEFSSSSSDHHAVNNNLFEVSSGDFWTEPFVSDNYSPSFSTDGVLLFPYEDSLDLFYQVMQELPQITESINF